MSTSLTYYNLAIKELEWFKALSTKFHALQSQGTSWNVTLQASLQSPNLQMPES